MNINLLDAKINGNNLVAGDEIGIFDGELCVGAVNLQKNLEETFDAITQSAVAGADDSETVEEDGFTSGNIISFKVWDESEAQLIGIETVKYYNPADGSEIEPQNFAIGATVYVSLSSNFNYIPKSNAGFDIQLYEGESGQLDGSESFDLDQDELSYAWSDLDSLGLIDLNVKSPDFIAPQVESTKDYRLVLLVSDGVNYSLPDTVIVTVLNVVSGPVANAGPDDITVTEKDTLVLDGTNSFDPDGLLLTWHWTVSTNAIELIASDSAIARLIAPEVSVNTSVFAILSVTNSSNLIAYDTVQVTILNNNIAPVAVANANVSINEGEQASLNGSDSYDPDSGPSELTYKWTALYGGELININSVTAVFTAPWLLSDSTFLFSLTVFDGEKYSSPDTAAITVLHVNLPPVASAGEDLTVNEGAEIFLNGDASFDPEGDSLLFQWNSDYFILDDVYAVEPVIVTDEIHRDTMVFVTLKVSDGVLWSVPDTVWISVKHENKSPQWISLPEDTVYWGRSYSGLIEVYDHDQYDTLTIAGNDLPSWINLTDNGNGRAELYSDFIPREENILGDWEFTIAASDGYITIDTSFTLHVSVLTSISNLELSTISVYPNPAHEKLTVKFDKPVSSNATLLLFDTFGKLIRQKNVEGQMEYLDVKTLSKGLYIMQVVEDSQIKITTKILID